MRRVWRQGDVHRQARIGHDICAVAHVVLDVTIKFLSVIVGLASKLLEDVGVRLVEDVREGVQAAAVCHPDDELLGTQLTAPLHNGVQSGQQALPPFHTETLLAHEFLLEELLEDGGLVELLENLLLLRLTEHRAIGQLNVVLEPVPAFRLADVHVLDADRMAVCLLEVRDDVAQRGCSDADFTAGLEDRVKVGLLQPEMGNAQVWAVVAPGADRVGLGKQVPPCPVCVDQVDDAELLGAHRSASSS